MLRFAAPGKDNPPPPPPHLQQGGVLFQVTGADLSHSSSIWDDAYVKTIAALSAGRLFHDKDVENKSFDSSRREGN